MSWYRTGFDDVGAMQHEDEPPTDMAQVASGVGKAAVCCVLLYTVVVFGEATVVIKLCDDISDGLVVVAIVWVPEDVTKLAV